MNKSITDCPTLTDTEWLARPPGDRGRCAVIARDEQYRRTTVAHLDQETTERVRADDVEEANRAWDDVRAVAQDLADDRGHFVEVWGADGKPVMEVEPTPTRSAVDE